MNTEHHDANIKFLDEEIAIATAVRDKYIAEREAGNKSPNMALLLRFNQHRLDSMKRIRQLFIESEGGVIATGSFDPVSFSDNLTGLAHQVSTGQLMYESGGAVLQEQDGQVSFTSTLVLRRPASIPA